jgi:hypothetical protein
MARDVERFFMSFFSHLDFFLCKERGSVHLPISSLHQVFKDRTAFLELHLAPPTGHVASRTEKARSKRRCSELTEKGFLFPFRARVTIRFLYLVFFSLADPVCICSKLGRTAYEQPQCRIFALHCLSVSHT